ncbi:helix-turn-helix domain-containing protein [Bradyrhizobium sp. HKCCYLS3077]|uniref:helix-turn-helix domain-containing protein n=1 Tax=Bradyrhizobium sp. HKCCYLS3077 TaxID=3420761 RepID=UPI003EC14AED
MSLLDHGVQKYPIGDILKSSAACSWPGVAAEVRMHPAGELPSITLEHMEIGIALSCHPNSIVSRKGDGLQQVTKVEPGTIWLCPAGTREEDIKVSAWHEVLHLYLPVGRFDQLSEFYPGARIRAHSIRYLGGIHDEYIRRIGQSLVDEMRAPSAAGHVRADSLAISLVARLAQRYSSDWSYGTNPAAVRAQLDERRVGRVIDFMIANIDQDLSIDDLASIACLSPFHFIRMFQKAVGKTPARYLNELRLERAKTLLVLGNAPLADIALGCCFSSQSNFTSAFRRATGVTPNEYRNTSR